MRIYSRIVQELQNIAFALRAQCALLPRVVANDVPYVCQFATPESAEQCLAKGVQPAEDSRWADTGAATPERYAQWAFTMCGMASAAMAIEHFTGRSESPALLAEDALAHGVYVEHPAEISAMRYAEFPEWFHGKTGLQAHVYTRLGVRGIEYALAHGALVMVSVNPNIRGYETAPRSQIGGHLVLVTGYDRDVGTVTINNPSGFASTRTQRGHTVPLTEFTKQYAGRGIVISRA